MAYKSIFPPKNGIVDMDFQRRVSSLDMASSLGSAPDGFPLGSTN